MAIIQFLLTSDTMVTMFVDPTHPTPGYINRCWAWFCLAQLQGSMMWISGSHVSIWRNLVDYMIYPPPRKFNSSPLKSSRGPIGIQGSSSNHHFSGAMLSFGGVYYLVLPEVYTPPNLPVLMVKLSQVKISNNVKLKELQNCRKWEMMVFESQQEKMKVTHRYHFRLIPLEYSPMCTFHHTQYS